MRFAIVFFLVALSGCAGLKQFPTDKIYEIDLDNQACGQYQITDYKKLKYKWLKDYPLSACNGVFGFASGDIPKVLDWGADAVKKCGSKCK